MGEHADDAIEAGMLAELEGDVWDEEENDDVVIGGFSYPPPRGATRYALPKPLTQMQELRLRQWLRSAQIEAETFAKEVR